MPRPRAARPASRLSPGTGGSRLSQRSAADRLTQETAAAPLSPNPAASRRRWPAAALALALALPACARTTTPATTGVLLDPAPAHVTPHADLQILRHRAAMGLAGAVRAELSPRLASAGDNPEPDPGRDALRGLAIELALVQGDQDAARGELVHLEQDVLRQGERASAELRASSAVLRGALLFAERRFADARSSHLRALVALEQGGPPSALKGTALRALARDQLALGEAESAVNTLGRAIEIHRDSQDAYIELHEDLLLAVDVMLALKQPTEAVIIASDAYNQALTGFGPDTLPHAEALLVVGSATMASGDSEAARTLVGDARQILEQLQTARSDPRLPISARALRRCEELSAALASTPALADAAPG
ncbi:tetratricopeptide repeat protein [Nannocystis sp.]|uniref:tetratricopeptide repeat protein n=1 Tax=Nannocystis sp. TaxID=1962667 RepID=UPI0025E53DC1|nr:tetratricopeptide repeat protein [Nannocystis sp.]MBK7827273.1 tetratricopeptide repeat protein [Nannocystis sp.]